MNRIDIHIDGMSCQHCVARVRAALAPLNGVRIEDVRVGRATVILEPRVTTDQVLDALNNSGYPAKPAEVGS